MFEPTSLHGIIPPMCTPLTDEGEIDVPSVHTLVEHLLGGGVHGIFALGSSGEVASLTAQQRQTVLQNVIAAVNHRVPVIVGILDTSSGRCIEQGLAARAAGADAVVLAPVYYYRVSQAELIEHFRLVKAAIGLPIIAYDVPTAVNIKMEYSTVVQLADEGVIAGIKDSSGATEGFRRVILGTRGSDFRVFTGSELIVDACLHMGAHGSVPGMANIFPREYVEIYERAQAGDWEGASAIQEPLLQCFFELISQGDPRYCVSSSALGGFKTGLKLRGAIRSTHLAAPLHSFGPADEQRVADVMRRHEFLK